MKRFLTLFLLSSLSYFYVTAETDAFNDLSEDDIEQITLRIIDKIDDFQDNLQTMADKNLSAQTRQAAYKANTLLFIGDCDPYSYSDNTGAVRQHPAVKMETSSLNSSRPSAQSMKLYFQKIMNNRAYSNIKIEAAEYVRVDNIFKVGNGKYEATATFLQYFTGYGDRGQIRYADKTEKTVKIFIDVKEIRTAQGTDIIIDAKLGDMKVRNTERIPAR